MAIWHSIRKRWHPLWRLRRLAAFRWIQQRVDCTIYTRIPGTGLRVAVKLLRDAVWIASPESLESEIRAAFALVLDRWKPAVFWDVGANIGYYSWLVRQHPAVRQVVLFEPDPTNHALITKTIQRNRILDCRAMKVALSDRCGETRFFVDRASGATGSLESAARPEEESSLHHDYRMTETIPCETATVDSLIADGVPPPNLMKIDVEGAEDLVLVGAEACLEKYRPVLFVETANAELVRRLEEIGYRAFRIDAENVLLIPETAEMDETPFSEAFVAYR